MRTSGVQLHPTSLPEGRLGPSAYAFVDWLAEAGQTVWQMLPLGPPDRHGSPYKSESAFACWEGLLADPDAPVSSADVVEFSRRHAYWIDSWRDAASQVRFAKEWGALRDYAAERGVRLMGDVPIYVAPVGADQRTWPQFFREDAVSGVPPDDYAETGQLWGNPLYDWDALAADGYRWWIERFRRTFELFDLVRVDHFRGFSAFWEVPAGDETALNGRWVKGPGAAVFEAVEAELGTIDVIAEDLGDIDDDVVELRRKLGYPGMAVMQFGFEEELSVHDLECHTEDKAVYTSTHDNDTVAGWWATLEPEVARAHSLHGPRRQLGDDRARLVLPGPPRHDPGSGHPRPRLRGPHEHPGHQGPLVEVADGARRPHQPTTRAGSASSPNQPTVANSASIGCLTRRWLAGMVALGDSITRGRGGAPALGVHPQSWAQWVAEALELPFTNLAVDGATSADVVRDQLPATPGSLRPREPVHRRQRRPRSPGRRYLRAGRDPHPRCPAVKKRSASSC